MNYLIEHLNAWGQQAVTVGWQILWQSSLLIVLLLALEWALGRRIRPAIRYLLWLVVLIKLVLPPSLALPTGVAWWMRPPAQSVRPAHRARVVVTYGRVEPVAPLSSVAVEPSTATPKLSLAGCLLTGAALVSLGLLFTMAWRWRQLALLTRRAQSNAVPDSFANLLDEVRQTAGVRRRVGVRVVPMAMSPALFGLFRPVVLLPESLTQCLSASRLRAVLLHELFHLRRGDVWVNCSQALLQIVYWWHPLLWVANQRIRRVREEAVDEAVMLALREEAESYAPTLLEVARLALPRPLASLGLLGILESHGALRQRIERLADFHPPRTSGATLASVLCAAAFGAAALPMGQSPAMTDNPEPSGKGTPLVSAAAVSKQADVLKLLQDGKLLYEMGKIQEAEKKFMLVLQQNPREQSAYYYLNLIKEARQKQQGPGLRYTSSGRQRILGKLNSLRLDRVQFDGAPLGDIVKSLAAESKRLDEAGGGINFIINSQGSGGQAPTQALAQVIVRVMPPLANVRLVDVLDAIVRTAEVPIKYSIEDYAIVFSFKGNEAPPLYTRVIKVDPRTFLSGLRSAMGKPDSADARDALKLLRDFLASINVDLASPKTVFWNDREGTVVVRATLQDLDTIETAIMVLNLAPPQVNLRAKFIEIPAPEEAAFWEGRGKVDVLPSGVRTVQLRSQETRSLFELWRTSNKTKVLNEASVTTLSGRQTCIEVQESKTIVTYTNSPQGHWVTNQVPVGPVLDALPTLSADTFRFDLSLTASMNEFLGYDDPSGQFGRQSAPGSDPSRSDTRGPVPHFRTVQLPVTATVWDGETLVIGGPKLPAAKPDPLKKRLLVVVTPTAIDPAGNRLHSEDEVERSRTAPLAPSLPRAPHTTQ